LTDFAFGAFLGHIILFDDVFLRFSLRLFAGEDDGMIGDDSGNAILGAAFVSTNVIVDASFDKQSGADLKGSLALFDQGGNIDLEKERRYH